MKRTWLKGMLALAVVAGASAVSGPAMAAPVYYTFEGNIITSYDTAGIIADSGLALGSMVSYTFLVDTELDGYYTMYNGSTEILSDYPGSDFFYTDLLSTPPIQSRLGQRYWEIYVGPYTITENNYGASSTGDPYGAAVYFWGGSSANPVEIWGNGTRMSSWTEGMSGFTGRTWAYDYNNNGEGSSLVANLTLTSISSTASVPEPSTLLLLGSGMAGLRFVSKFRNKKA